MYAWMSIHRRSEKVTVFPSPTFHFLTCGLKKELDWPQTLPCLAFSFPTTGKCHHINRVCLEWDLGWTCWCIPLILVLEDRWISWAWGQSGVKVSKKPAAIPQLLTWYLGKYSSGTVHWTAQEKVPSLLLAKHCMSESYSCKFVQSQFRFRPLNEPLTGGLGPLIRDGDKLLKLVFPFSLIPMILERLDTG